MAGSLARGVGGCEMRQRRRIVRRRTQRITISDEVPGIIGSTCCLNGLSAIFCLKIATVLIAIGGGVLRPPVGRPSAGTARRIDPSC